MNRCHGHTIFVTVLRCVNGLDYEMAIECFDCGARAVGFFVDPKRTLLVGGRVRPTSVTWARPRPPGAPPSRPWTPPAPKPETWSSTYKPWLNAETHEFRFGDTTFTFRKPPQRTATQEAFENERASRARHEQGESRQAPSDAFSKATGDALWAAFREDMKKRRPFPPFISPL